MTPRNFVVLFHEREGSSAIIDLLGNHPQLRVPLFEELDEYNAPQFSTHATIARLADLTFQTGDFPLARRLLEEGREPVDEERATQGVGFKWRIWGPTRPIVQMLQDRQVVVFHLFRMQLAELAASLIFTNTVIPELERAGEQFEGGGHLQFKLATMASEQRATFQRRLLGIKFRLDPARVVEIARETLAFKQRVHDTYLRPLQQAGIAVRSLVYEDFLTDRNGFLEAVCAEIGVESAPLRRADPYYKKVTLRELSSQVPNWADMRRDPELRAIMADYRKLIGREHIYLPPAHLR